MSILKAKCPRCRNELDTGIHADEETFEDLEANLNVLVLCDDCREYQRMLVKDLYTATEQADAFRLIAT
jgi:hypothetical protein